MSIDLRVGAVVVKAADALAVELCGSGCAADVDHVPKRGKVDQHYKVVIGMPAPSGSVTTEPGSNDVVMIIPGAVAEMWGEKIIDLTREANDWRRGAVASVHRSSSDYSADSEAAE